MLLTKEVEVKWNTRNKNKYVDLGYNFTNIGDSLYVKVEDLGVHSKLMVECLCDYCLDNCINTKVVKYYENYNKERKNVQKDTCNNCKQEKYRDYLLIKQNNGELKIEDKGYFNFKENRLKELDKYINKYGIIDKMEHGEDKEGRKLYGAIIKNKEKPYELALELGYDLDEVMKRKPDGFYRKFSNLEKSIKKIINKLGRFPTSNELKKELNIDHKYINYHGGFHEIKRKMNYIGEYDLVDSTGFYNSSSYEYELAEYLIKNKIKYKREQHPFKNENYRSDFTLLIEKNGIYEKLEIEVWGYLKSNNNKIAIEYNKVRKIKENLYHTNGIKYISIEPTVFLMKKNKQIIKSLNDIFSPILEYALKCDVYNSKKYTGKMPDEKLYKEVMKLSKDKVSIPTTVEIRNKNRSIYMEILKRYESYSNFAEKYGMRTQYKPNNYWTEDKIFEIFDNMIINYGKILSRRDCDKHLDDIIVADYAKVSYSFKIKDLKLKYYGMKISDKNFIIPSNDLKWIKQVEVNLSRRGNIPYTPEQQAQAKQILEKYNYLKLTPTS